MKKILITIVFILVTTTLGGCSMFKSKNELSHEEMIKIVRSEEFKNLLEDYLRKNDDPNAFTEKGIIKSYTIKEDEIKWNPMGAIMVYMYINDDEDLELDVFLDRKNGKLILTSSGYSPELEAYLKKEMSLNE